MAVAFMMFIKELRRNGGETAATAKNRHLPPNFFFAISRWITYFWIIWAQLFFFKKFSLTFALNTCDFWLNGKIFKCQMIQKCLIQREIAKKNLRQMTVFGGCGGFAAVSSHFLNKHHKNNYHTKAQCCNSFFGWVLMVSKSGTSAPLPFKVFFLNKGFFLLKLKDFLTIYTFIMRLHYGRLYFSEEPNSD